MFNDKYEDNMEELERFCNNDCEIVVYKDIDICVPITVEPYVNLHEAEVEYIDEPFIVANSNWSKCKNGTCKFNLAQKLCVMIPIEFKAKATSGPTSVLCGDASDEECPTYVCCERDEESYYPRNSPFNFYIKGRKIN